MKLIPKNEEEWKKALTPEQYRILREKGTEVPFTGTYAYSKDKGIFECVACGNPLFSSDAKFDSGTGWPSFDQPISDESVEYKPDHSGGIERVEVLCKRCGSHLGHVFDDGPTDTGKRFCMNSVCLDLGKK